MGCIVVSLNRVGSTPTASIVREGATATAEVEYLGGVPIASLIGLSDVPTAVLEHLGGMTVSGSLLCHVANDSLGISETSLSFTNEEVGAVKSFSIRATSDWTAELIDPMGMFSISTTSGIGGLIGKVAITLVAENTDSSQYNASVVVKCGGLREVLSLTVEAGAVAYTRLTYIECTGEQYINTGYVVQEDDVIEMQYITTDATSSDKAMFGVRDNSGHLYTTIYSNAAYVRFGSNETTTVSNARQKYTIKLQKSSVDIDGTKATPAFDSMPSSPLYLFASNSYNNEANMYGKFKSNGFKISKSNGSVVMDLKPYKRDSDGAIGMLDVVSGTFFTNEGTGAEFKYGGEARITNGYELMEYLTFNNDKIFDTGYYGNEKTYFEMLFRRTDTSGADYLFGCSSDSRITGYLTSSGYWRYGNGYPTFNTNNKLLIYAEVTPGSTTVAGTTKTFSIGGSFTTAFTIPVGGYKPSSGVATPTYQGYIYYFRMKIDDEYVADYAPCKRISDGAEGFWDCVSQTFVESI